MTPKNFHNSNKKPRSGGEPHRNPIRVRSKRLDDLDESKLTLAYWLLAKRLVESGADLSGLTETAVRAASDELDDTAQPDSDAAISAEQS